MRRLKSQKKRNWWDAVVGIFATNIRHLVGGEEKESLRGGKGRVPGKTRRCRHKTRHVFIQQRTKQPE